MISWSMDPPGPAYPAPCYIEGQWVDSAGGLFKVHQQETFFTASHNEWSAGMFATMESDLSFESSGPLGVSVRGHLTHGSASMYPPPCAYMHFDLPNGSKYTWCNANAGIVCPAAKPSPPLPPLPTLTLRPYPWLTAGNCSGRAGSLPGSHLSPDPLVNCSWPAGTSDDGLQLYTVPPKIVDTQTPSSFVGLDTLVHGGGTGSVEVRGAGTFRIDFGAEFAGWIELTSDDMPLAVATNGLWLGISEDNAQRPTKTKLPVAHAGGVWRLETNALVYEGVRFGFITVGDDGGATWHITSVLGVAQTLPVRYTGAFDAPSSPVLTKVWWTGAYCPKLNMAGPPIPGALVPSTRMLNAVLVDRGDRYGWTGDDHVAQNAIMKAFGASQHSFVRESLWNTHNDSNSIRGYGLMWCESVVDYYTESGDDATLTMYARNVDAKLRAAAAVEGSPSRWGAAAAWSRPSLDFYGWDERLGSGFEGGSCNESQRIFSMTIARASLAFATALSSLNASVHSANPWLVSMAAAHRRAHETIAANTLGGGGTAPFEHFGMHAAAHAILASIAPVATHAALLTRHFNDSAQICSWAPFNQYWLIQALGVLSLPHAVDAVTLCWGGMLELGATTFWEAFAPDWVHTFAPSEPIPGFANGETSMCHPYASGVTAWMSEALLGVRPLEAGYANWSLRPMRDAVRGTVETPHGTIEVDWSPPALRLVVPPSTTIGVVALPIECDAGAATIAVSATVNGRATSVQFEQESEHPGRQWCHALLRDLAREVSAQRRELHIVLHVASPPLAAPGRDAPRPSLYAAPAYAARWLPPDRTTGGVWRGVYGALGHVIFSPTADGVDAVALPPGVRTSTNAAEPRISPWHPEHGTLVWAPGAPGCMLQVPAPASPAARGLGTAVNINSTNHFNAYVDVTSSAAASAASMPLRTSSRVVISLYFCDAQPAAPGASGLVDSNRFGIVPTALGSVVEAEQSSPLGAASEAGQVLAPLAVVADFAAGTWLRLEVDAAQSIRFRFAYIRGPIGGTLAAILFDPAPATPAV